MNPRGFAFVRALPGRLCRTTAGRTLLFLCVVALMVDVVIFTVLKTEAAQNSTKNATFGIIKTSTNIKAPTNSTRVKASIASAFPNNMPEVSHELIKPKQMQKVFHKPKKQMVKVNHKPIQSIKTPKVSQELPLHTKIREVGQERVKPKRTPMVSHAPLKPKQGQKDNLNSKDLNEALKVSHVSMQRIKKPEVSNKQIRPIKMPKDGHESVNSTMIKKISHNMPIQPKKILYWGTYFGRSQWVFYEGEMECKQPDSKMVKCIATGDTNEYPEVDALVFHAHDQSPLPDLSIRPQSQIWLYTNGESYPGVFATSQRNRNLINWTMKPIEESDVFFGFGETTRGKFKNGFDPDKNYLEGRTRSVATMISNCASNRLSVVTELAKYIDVDIYGSCGIGKVCLKDEECFEIFQQYKFYLAFENSFCKDYVTEKFFVHGLTRGMVPVVLGGANYTRIAPPHSYINAMRFKSMKRLAGFLKKVGSSPTRYNEYFKWYSHYEILPQFQLCPVCVALHKSDGTPKWYDSIQDWHAQYGKCYPYPNFGIHYYL